MIIWKYSSLWLIVLLLGRSSFAANGELIASSGPNRVQLIELYSSESCSSCPPADEWASKLKNEADLWKTFVPVVFHVDYWNHLGWKDGLSSELMTKRQAKISQLWPNPAVYTPALIVDGKEWRDWRSAKGFHLPTSDKSQEIGLQLYRNSEGQFTVKTAGLKSSKKFVIRAAQLGMDLVSNVTGGENSGLTLRHNFVVLQWDSQIVSGKNLEAQFKFSKSDPRARRLAVAFWVEEDGNPTPLQAVGTYL